MGMETRMRIDKLITTSDIGEHYVKLKQAGVKDAEVGSALWRFVRSLGERGEGEDVLVRKQKEVKRNANVPET